MELSLISASPTIGDPLYPGKVWGQNNVHGLSEHKLKIAVDAVQTYQSGLQSQARPAPRLCRPSEENPEYTLLQVDLKRQLLCQHLQRSRSKTSLLRKLLKDVPYRRRSLFQYLLMRSSQSLSAKRDPKR